MVVENVQTRVQIFDLMGRLIQSSNATGDFHSKNLNAGIYLVHVDGSVQKVSVR
jgi:hypothetical protein